MSESLPEMVNVQWTLRLSADVVAFLEQEAQRSTDQYRRDIPDALNSDPVTAAVIAADIVERTVLQIMAQRGIKTRP